MRIYTSTADAIDLCRRCAAGLTEDAAFARWGHLGDGPDDRGNCFGYDVPAPHYGTFDDDYHCDECGRTLTARDCDPQLTLLRARS